MTNLASVHYTYLGTGTSRDAAKKRSSYQSETPVFAETWKYLASKWWKIDIDTTLKCC